MTFSTLVTPTRESETCSVGTWFWTSSSDTAMRFTIDRRRCGPARLALRHRLGEVRIAHRNDPESGVQEEERPGRRLKSRASAPLRREHAVTRMSHLRGRKFTHSAPSVPGILRYKSRRRTQEAESASEESAGF